jgi:hypothetical protein
MNLTSIEVKSNVDFSGMNSTNTIDARKAHVGELLFREAVLQTPGKKTPLILDGAVITGSLVMDGVRTEGAITARGTRMNGLDLSHTSLQSALGSQALELSRSEIAGRANLNGTNANAATGPRSGRLLLLLLLLTALSSRTALKTGLDMTTGFLALAPRD